MAKDAAITYLRRNFEGSPCRVLLADDNQDALVMLALLLQLAGYETCTAQDGLEVVAIALDFQPDVAILDIDMPGLSGYEVAQWCRRTEPLVRLPLIALTGRVGPEERRRALQAGFDAHLAKPAHSEELISLIVLLTQK